jgi:UDP-N-acetylmuramoylalanine--D-glutamate ligase
MTGVSSGWRDDARGEAAWVGVHVCVAGSGVSGAAVVRVLDQRGAHVTTVDATLGNDDVLPPDAELVVTSPGWRPMHPLFAQATARGVPVWGEVELAWRLRDPAVPWLGVTGTNGKTTAVQMLASILRAAGHRAVACGNVGLPVLDAALADPPYDMLAVELSSFQLHWTSTVALHAGAVLNLAPDHLDWHGSMTGYAEDKAKVWRGGAVPVVNADDQAVRALAAGRMTVPTVEFTLGEPAPGQLGVRAGTLLERTYSPASGVASRAIGGGEGGAGEGADAGGVVLADVGDVRPAAPHNVANALAAAALARSLDHAGLFPVPPDAVARGLRAFRPDPHRIALVASIDGVNYVDDSKATNPHAAAASLAAFDPVVWIAGGLAKGAEFDEVVAGAAGRLRGVVLVGRDRAVIADALTRHAPEVPVVDVSATDTGAMDDVVRAARGLARPGDTVLLAPACASMDMFDNYGERGDAFAAAVGRLTP